MVQGVDMQGDLVVWAIQEARQVGIMRHGLCLVQVMLL